MSIGIKKARDLRRQKRKHEKEFISDNWLIGSDYKLSLKLDVTVRKVKAIRHRLGLIRTPEQTKNLKYVSDRKRGLGGHSNAFGERIEKDSY